MPTYDYECATCGRTTERFYKIYDAPGTITCPSCGWENAKRIISRPSIQCDSSTDVKWLSSACRNLLPDGHRPIETRGQYKRYLKDHGVVERC